MVLLMNPNPSLPNKLRMYKYQEKDKWTMEELVAFQDALVRYGKDFTLVAKEIGTKGREECVSFYHVWKKVFPQEYQQARAVWKMSDAKFTEELLKTVPPPLSSSSTLNGRINNNRRHHHHHLDSIIPMESSKVRFHVKFIWPLDHGSPLPFYFYSRVSTSGHDYGHEMDVACSCLNKLFAFIYAHVGQLNI